MKGLLLLNNDVEDIEAIGTRDLLIRAGFNITTFTLEDDLEIQTAHGLKIKADELIKNIHADNFDFLILPGGKHVSKWSKIKTKLDNLIIKFNSDKKLIAAICAAPLFLNNLGLLKNKKYTIFPPLEINVIGNYDKNKRIIQDENIITAKSVSATFEFVFEICKYLKSEDDVLKLKNNIVYY